MPERGQRGGTTAARDRGKVREATAMRRWSSRRRREDPAMEIESANGQRKTKKGGNCHLFAVGLPFFRLFIYLPFFLFGLHTDFRSPLLNIHVISDSDQIQFGSN